MTGFRPPLLDHLVRGRQYRFRDGEAERLGGLEVDDQLLTSDGAPAPTYPKVKPWWHRYPDGRATVLLFGLTLLAGWQSDDCMKIGISLSVVTFVGLSASFSLDMETN
jgi:hypothetical protein